MHDFVPFQGLLYVYDYQNDVDTESFAGFLHLDYKFTDHFAITLGGRYTNEKTRSSLAARPISTASPTSRAGCNPHGAVFDPLPFAPPTFSEHPESHGRDVSAGPGFPSTTTNPLRYFPPDAAEQDFHGIHA